MLVCLSICLFIINVKMSEMTAGPNVLYGNSNDPILAWNLMPIFIIFKFIFNFDIFLFLYDCTGQDKLSLRIIERKPNQCKRQNHDHSSC